MSITAKLVTGTQKTVDVPDLSITVADLKKLLAPEVEIPEDEQRLVLRGKVLRDADILSAAGLEHGNAIHVVRSKKKATTEASPTPSTTPVQSTAPAAASAASQNSSAAVPSSTANPVNPYASLFGGYAPPPMTNNMNLGGMDSSAMGLPAGFGAPNEQMMQMAQNPAMMQMAAQFMQDPQMMRMMAEMPPSMTGLSPQQSEMFREIAQNPELMRGMANMAARMASGSGGTTNAAPGPQQGSANPPFAAPGFFGGLPPVAPPPQGNPREIYRDQLQQLRDMGFPNEEANLAALQQAQGSVSFAIERLLNS